MDETAMLAEHGPMIDRIANRSYRTARRLTTRERGWLTYEDFRQEARLIAIVEFRKFDPLLSPSLKMFLSFRVKRRLIDRLRTLGFDARTESVNSHGRHRRTSFDAYLARSSKYSIEAMSEGDRPIMGADADLAAVREIDQWIERDALLGAIATLTDQEQAVYLRRLDGATLMAIADEMNLTESRICQILTAGRPRLAALLAPAA